MENHTPRRNTQLLALKFLHYILDAHLVYEEVCNICVYYLFHVTDGWKWLNGEAHCPDNSQTPTPTGEGVEGKGLLREGTGGWKGASQFMDYICLREKFHIAVPVCLLTKVEHTQHRNTQPLALKFLHYILETHFGRASCIRGSMHYVCVLYIPLYRLQCDTLATRCSADILHYGTLCYTRLGAQASTIHHGARASHE